MQARDRVQTHNPQLGDEERVPLTVDPDSSRLLRLRMTKDDGSGLERYVEACLRMKTQSPLPFGGPVTLPQIVAAYELRRQSDQFDLAPYADLSLLHGWYGDPETAIRYVEQGCQLIEKWPDKARATVGPVREWQQSLVELIVNRELAAASIEQQVDCLKVGQIAEQAIS